MSSPRFGFSEAVRRLRPTVSDIIWKLHRIIANPNSKLDEVRTARRRLLRLLKTSKFQEMIVPPLALPVEPTDGATAATKRLDSTDLFELCGHPVSRDVAKARVPECRRALAQAPQRTSALIICSLRGAPPRLPTQSAPHLTITRIEDPLELERKSSAPPAQLTGRKASGAFNQEYRYGSNPSGIHMQNPPDCLSLGAAFRELGARKLGANAHFANGVPVGQSYGRTKFRVPCSIERWENEGGRIV